MALWGVSTEVLAGPELIRAINKRRVLRLIRAAGPLSRADAAEQTNLTRPTISAVVAELIDQGWVEEMGTGESSGGRPPILLRFNPRARWVVGAELGAGHVRAVLADLRGEVVHRVKYRVQSSDPFTEIARVQNAIEELVAGRPSPEPVAGVGLGITGVVDRKTGLWRYSPHFDVSDLPAASLLQERLGLPVWLENDARAMAWGERSFGVARGVDNLVYIRVGVGIGAGIVIRGELYGGAHEGAGEFGHWLMKEHGPRCRCGRDGCLEAVASATAIARAARERIQAGEQSLIPDLVGLAGGDLDGLMGSTVIEAGAKGDRLAQEILAEAGRYLGYAIGNLINLLNPSMVIVGGGVSRAGGLLMTPLSEAAKARTLPALKERVQLILSPSGEDSCPLGGAALVIEELFRVPSMG
ncbi:MAG TPA: ROK family transcriptional regulator [Symbiobacteriaceae bacterium]|jgi:glucokinase-like ROK family protein